MLSTIYFFVVVYFLVAFLRDISKEPSSMDRSLGLIAIAVAVWALPLIALYFVGMIVGWVVRGFRTNAR